MHKAMQFYFNRAWRGVVAQGKPAYEAEGNQCFYMQPKTGCRCAVGHMVSPNVAAYLERHYAGNDISGIKSTSRMPARLRALLRDMGGRGFDMVQSIQCAHDTSAMTEHDGDGNFLDLFKADMRDIASRFRLTVPAEKESKA